MSTSSFRVCFDGQELIQALVMHFKFDEKKVMYMLCIIFRIVEFSVTTPLSFCALALLQRVLEAHVSK